MNQNGQRSSFDSKQSNDFDQYKMSYSEAMEILGLKPGAKKSEINKSYHRLMQSVHPDKGGSSYLAQKINQARSVVLKK